MANHYVLQSATGSADGSDWTNAWTTLPATLTRGDTYYIADGTYIGYTFNDDVSGTDLITIKKATSADHGTETGWDSSYGDGVAEFTSKLEFDTSYWLLDGAVGSGTSGYGFKITTTDTLTASKLILVDNGSDYITVQYVEMEHAGEDTGLNQDCVYIVDSDNGGSSYITISHCYMHDVNRVMMLLNWTTHLTIEYCYFKNRHDNSDPAIHGEAIAINYSGLSAGTVIKYCTFENIDGTGIVVIKDSIQSGFQVFGNLFFVSGEASRYTPSQGTICDTGGDTTTNVKFHNNTMVDISGSTGVNWLNDATDNEAYNNLWFNCESITFGNVAHDYNAFETTEGEDHEQIGITSAIFSDYAGDDFTLSGATDAGDNTIGATYNTDMLGNTRGADSVWDRGAYEYVADQGVHGNRMRIF